MDGRRVVPGACVLVALLAIASAAPAGAQCLEGTRPLVTIERKFFNETLEAIKSAIPKPPEGWRIADATEVRAPRGICIGRERQPLSIEFFVQFEAVDAGGTAPRLVPASQGSRPARILVTVNAKQESFDPHVEQLAVPEVTLAFEDAAGTPGRTSLGLLIGDWSLFRPEDPSERLEAMAHFDLQVRYTRVQSISVKLDGPPAPVTQLMAGLDIQALKELLPKLRSPSGGR